MNQRIIINATIKTMAPLSIKMPQAEGVREGEFDNFPLMTRGIDEAGNKLKTGFLPATTVRGFLRRAVTLRRMQEAAEASKPYRLPQIYSEMIGQDAESEKQAGDIDLLAIKAAREASPVLDLFGSGLGIKSRLLVSHFVPNWNVLPDVFTGVRKDLDDTEEALELMAKSDMGAFLGRSESNNRRAAAAALVKQLEGKVRRAKKDADAVADDLTKALAVAKAEMEKFAGEMGDMQNSTRTIVQHWALASGVHLAGRMVIERALDRDVEMMEYALDQLSRKPVLGAHSARGCGEIEGTFEFHDADGKLLKTIAIGGYKPSRVTTFS